MNAQHFQTGPTTKTTSAQALARAFFASLAVHVAIFGVFWWIVAAQPPAAPSMLRIELAPRANAMSATSASIPAETARARIEPKPERLAAAHPDRLARASTASASRALPPAASPQPAAGLSSTVSEPTRATAADVATSSSAELAIDLRVLDWLARHRDYPLAARRARIEGVVQLRVTLMPDGRLVDATVAHSSGHPLLDQAALELMTRASPLPAEFAGARTEQIELQLPIVYRMRASST